MKGITITEANFVLYNSAQWNILIARGKMRQKISLKREIHWRWLAEDSKHFCVSSPASARAHMGRSVRAHTWVGACVRTHGLERACARICWSVCRSVG